MTAVSIVVGAMLASALAAGAGAGAAQTRDGRQVYEREKCATCHQIARRGNSRYPLDGVGSRLTAEEIRRWITRPAEMEAALPRMPALRMSTMKSRLDKEELEALVAYLQTLK
jgi:mono/diheme cytochrome c family protein